MRWPDGVVSPLNMPSWRDFPLREALEERYPGVPVAVHNDAVCFALGEHAHGAGRGEPDLLGVVVSTGVGAGVVLGGRVLDGATGSAGHLGHVVVDPDGPECGCGGPRLPGGRRPWSGRRRLGPRPRLDGAGRAGARRTGGGRRRGRSARTGPGRSGARHGAGVRGSAARRASRRRRRRAVAGRRGAVGPAARGGRRARAPSFTAGLHVVPAELGQQAGLVGAAALVLPVPHSRP
jgi:glucokinase